MSKHGRYALSMVILITLIFGVFLIFISVSSRLDEVSNMVIKDIDLSVIEDGIYEGESDVSPLYISINVEIENRQIKTISVKYHNVFVRDDDIEEIIKLIYDKQSLSN